MSVSVGRSRRPRRTATPHYDGPVIAIDWIVIRSAALAGLFVLVPSIVVLTLVLDDSASSLWIYLFGLLLVFGFLTAGYGAGRARSDTPMIHGAIAGLSCYLVIQLFGSISRLIRGESVNPLQYPFLAVLSAALAPAAHCSPTGIDERASAARPMLTRVPRSAFAFFPASAEHTPNAEGKARLA